MVIKRKGKRKLSEIRRNKKQKGDENMTVDFAIFVQAFRNWGPSMYDHVYKQTY